MEFLITWSFFETSVGIFQLGNCNCKQMDWDKIETLTRYFSRLHLVSCVTLIVCLIIIVTKIFLWENFRKIIVIKIVINVSKTNDFKIIMKYWLVYDYKKLYKGSCGSHHVQTLYFKRHVESKSLMVSGTEYYKRYGISTDFYMVALTLIWTILYGSTLNNWMQSILVPPILAMPLI